MSDMVIGLLSGGAGGAVFALVWTKVDDARARRRAARQQAEWEADIEQAVKLSETPLFDQIQRERTEAGR